MKCVGSRWSPLCPRDKIEGGSSNALFYTAKIERAIISRDQNKQKEDKKKNIENKQDKSLVTLIPF